MANTYLTRSLTGTSQTTGTFSFWVKRGKITSASSLYQTLTSDPQCGIQFRGDDRFEFYTYNGGYISQRRTNRLFRDTNAWYHIVVAIDTTQATADDRVKLYVNGIQETSMNASSNPSQNSDSFIINKNSIKIGSSDGTNDMFDGSMSHFHFIDGTAYDATAFGEYDANGVWKINTSPSVTYGTNGFFILKDGNSVTDQSPNTNNFTVGGGTLTNTEDSPSNVFATWNPLVPLGSFSNGNTVWTSVSSGDGSAFSTLGAETGKYYMECKITNANASGWELGVAPVTRLDGNASGVGTSTIGGVGYTGDGFIRRAGTTVASGLTTFAQNDIISCALDMDTRKVYFYKNGTILNSGTGVDLPSTTGHYVFATGDWYSAASTSASANFGNGYFGTTPVITAGTNASGIGIFEYDVPTGYTALSTKGLNL